jgi:hypothetical protein
VGQVYDASEVEAVAPFGEYVGRPLDKSALVTCQSVPAAPLVGGQVNMSDKPMTSPLGGALSAETMRALRALIAERGAPALTGIFGASRSSIERAAAGGRVQRGTRELIRLGIERLRAAEGSPSLRDGKTTR